MTLIRLSTQPLFKREEGKLISKPKFNRNEVDLCVSRQESRSWTMDEPAQIYSVAMPRCNYRYSISREFNKEFHGDATDLINVWLRENKNDPTYKKEYAWLLENMHGLNASKYYWAAIRAREQAELNILKANIAAAQLESYITYNIPLTPDEIKQVVTEYGYDPELSWGYM
jgi:hypothetical protein